MRDSEKWLPVIPTFQLLCLFGLERSIGATSGSSFLALGRSELVLRVLMVKLAVMAICIVPLTTRDGISRASMAVSLSAIAVQMAVVPVVAKLLRMSVFKAVAPWLKPLGGGLLLLATVLLVKACLSWWSDPWVLLSLTALGMLVYAGFVAIAERQLLQELRRRLGSWAVPLQNQQLMD